MKLASICILLVCLLGATFSQGLIILSYQFNQNYIANTLCVNRNNPKAHCNGHCYLKKQLNNEEQPANPLSTTIKEKLEAQLFCNEYNPFEFAQFIQAQHTGLTPAHFAEQQVLRKCFRPPC